MTSTQDQPRPMREQVEAYITQLQGQIVDALEELDPSAPKFNRDSWVRAQGGMGKSCVFSVPFSPSVDGQEPETILEKAGINISVVHGTLPPAAIKQMRVDHSSIPYDASRPNPLAFFAAGISLVIHPRNPNAPTVHANYRYFEVSEPDSDEEKEKAKEKKEDKPILAWWFGGGCDLTPSYLFPTDVVHFHNTLKQACDQHSEVFYPAFKKWCDEYFFIPHRGESRGVGGIFFDDLCAEDHARLSESQSGSGNDVPTGSNDPTRPRPRTPESIFSFVQTLGNAFIPSYLPLLRTRSVVPFTPHMRRWQIVRRGRYVEFNLVYDRGTKFGLMTPGARVESILMSLPEVARWEYNSELGSDFEGKEEEKSEEGKLVWVLRNPREWV